MHFLILIQTKMKYSVVILGSRILVGFMTTGAVAILANYVDPSTAKGIMDNLANVIVLVVAAVTGTDITAYQQAKKKGAKDASLQK